jgi:hypothetical protein
LKNHSNDISVEAIEQTSDVRDSDIVLNPELLVDFANCKYKAAKRIACPSCPNSPSEVDTHGLTPVALKTEILTGVGLYLFSPEIRHIAL